MESNKYPELYLSLALEKIVSAFPPIKSGIAPQKPIEPKCPQEPVNDAGCGGFGIVFGAIAILVYYLGSQMTGGTPYFLMIICIVASILFICLHFSFSSQHEKDLKEYNLEKIQYERDRQEYILKLAEYEEEKIKYDEAKQLALEESQKQCNFVPFRQEHLRKYIKNHKPSYSSSSKEVLEGPIEEKFFNLCLQYGLSVTRNKVANVSGFNYYPDIVWDSDGMLFDIEIDEPYTIADGSPIHYLDNYGKSIDADRNKRFIQSNWNVIRFSEEQICTYPLACVCFLLAVANSIRRGVFDRDRLLQEYSLLSTDKWDKEQSHKWAYFHYRETYLHLIDNLPSVKYNIINTDHTSYIPIVEDSEDEECIRWYEEKDLEIDVSSFLPIAANSISCVPLEIFIKKYGNLYVEDVGFDKIVIAKDEKGTVTIIHIPDKDNFWKLPDFPNTASCSQSQIIEYLKINNKKLIVCTEQRDGKFFPILYRSDCLKFLFGIKYLKNKNALIPEYNSWGINPVLRVRQNTIHIEDWTETIDVYGIIDSCPNDSNFSRGSQITEIVLNLEIKSLGYACFAGLKNLKKINLPENLLEIKDLAFYGCEKLRKIDIPGNVNNIPRFAFSGCSSIERITLQEGIIAIGEYAFENCVSLQNLILPKSMISFNMESITGCDHLETITINNPYMHIIEDQTFDQYSYPSNLKKVYVPKGSLDYYSIYFDPELLDDTDLIV